MKHRHFIALLCMPVLLLAPLSVILALWMQPVTGDSARIGGVPEALVGWQAPQWMFEHNPLPQPPDANRYPRATPVVVIGDSFSLYPRQRPFSWPLFFHDLSGLDITLYNRHYWHPLQFIESRHYREAPPALLVYQFGERELDKLIPAIVRGDCRPGPVLPAPDLPLAPRHLPRQAQIRDTGRASLGEAMNLIRQRLLFWKNNTRLLPLTRDDLFSSRWSDRLLILRSELRKYRHTEVDWRQLGCHFLELQHRVEANGHTKFVLMLVPDKPSIYGPYLKGRQYAPVIPHIAVPGLSLLRLDQVLAEAVAAGVPDIYWPNDTHWGPAGSERVAIALRDYLYPTQ